MEKYEELDFVFTGVKRLGDKWAFVAQPAFCFDISFETKEKEELAWEIMKSETRFNIIRENGKVSIKPDYKD